MTQIPTSQIPCRPTPTEAAKAGGIRSMTPIVAPERISAAIAQLLGQLVGDYDLDEFTCALVEQAARLWDAAAVGLVLVEGSGRPQRVALSTNGAELGALLRSGSDDGPACEAVRTGVPVHAADLDGSPARWPAWTPAALELGVRSVTATPMLVRGQTIGAVVALFRAPRLVDEGQVDATVMIAHVASLVVLGEHARVRAVTLADQLQAALRSRIVIEQAKGVLAERGHVSTDQAFEQLRRYARNNGRKIHLVAGEVVTGGLTALR